MFLRNSRPNNVPLISTVFLTLFMFFILYFIFRTRRSASSAHTVKLFFSFCLEHFLIFHFRVVCINPWKVGNRTQSPSSVGFQKLNVSPLLYFPVVRANNTIRLCPSNHRSHCCDGIIQINNIFYYSGEF